MNLLSRSSARPLSCRQVGKLLQTFLDGETDEITDERLAEHLEQCRRCGMAADTFLQIKASLARRGTHGSPAALTRLREFVARLADGDVDRDGSPSGP